MKKYIYALLAFFISCPIYAQTIEDISFYTEEYPPYNFLGPDGRLRGISIEILEEVLKVMNSKRSAQETKLLSWDEVYNNLLSGKNVMGFATSRSSSREKLFKWAGPIIFSRTIVIGAVDGPKLEKVSELKNYKIAVIKNDVGHHVAQKAGVKNENLVLALHMDEIIKAIDEGKADFWVYEESVLKWYLKSKGISHKYKEKLTLESSNLSYAFSKDVSDKLVVEFQDALDTLKSGDIYFNILERYIK